MLENRCFMQMQDSDKELIILINHLNYYKFYSPKVFLGTDKAASGI